MAMPIKETPILKGKDAKKFLEEMKKAESIKVANSEIERIRANFKKFKAIATFYS